MIVYILKMTVISMSGFSFPKEMQKTIGNALAQTTQVPLQKAFISPGHAKILHPDAMLVVGIRGVGKSFWWTALQDEQYRRMISRLIPGSNIDTKTDVSAGFGEYSSPGDYPSKRIFKRLVTKFDIHQIWRTIVLRQVTKNITDNLPFRDGDWFKSVGWVINHPKEVEDMLHRVDQDLDRANKYHLVLFDALDWVADDRSIEPGIVQGLLWVLFEFKSYRRIRPKAFVRPDHLKAWGVPNHPNVRRILNRKVELRWSKNDLYGLLWQYLGNDPVGGELFRNGCEKMLGIEWKQYQQVWIVPERLRIEEHAQREIFHAIAGPQMGMNRRRGDPYTWIPNHLKDSSGQISPRSFLTAIHYAANDNTYADTDNKYPLHYKSIEQGIREASRIRILEMQEDYPWLDIPMKPLSGLMIPCRFEDIAKRWGDYCVLSCLEDATVNVSRMIALPEINWETSCRSLRRSLETLGIFERMEDGRVNIPSIYRIGFGLKRRGGIRKSEKGQSSPREILNVGEPEPNR